MMSWKILNHIFITRSSTENIKLLFRYKSLHWHRLFLIHLDELEENNNTLILPLSGAVGDDANVRVSLTSTSERDKTGKLASEYYRGRTKCVI